MSPLAIERRNTVSIRLSISDEISSFSHLDPFQPVFPEHTQPVQKPGEEGIVWGFKKNYYKIFSDLVVVDICLKISGLTLGVER